VKIFEKEFFLTFDGEKSFQKDSDLSFSVGVKNDIGLAWKKKHSVRFFSIFEKISTHEFSSRKHLHRNRAANSEFEVHNLQITRKTRFRHSKHTFSLKKLEIFVKKPQISEISARHLVIKYSKWQKKLAVTKFLMSFLESVTSNYLGKKINLRVFFFPTLIN